MEGPLSQNVLQKTHPSCLLIRRCATSLCSSLNYLHYVIHDGLIHLLLHDPADIDLIEMQGYICIPEPCLPNVSYPEIGEGV